MTSATFLRTTGTIAAFGFVIAVVSAVLYFMALPIFSATELAWAFFYGLIAFAVAVLALAVRSIWDTTP